MCPTGKVSSEISGTNFGSAYKKWQFKVPSPMSLSGKIWSRPSFCVNIGAAYSNIIQGTAARGSTNLEQWHSEAFPPLSRKRFATAASLSAIRPLPTRGLLAQGLPVNIRLDAIYTSSVFSHSIQHKATSPLHYRFGNRCRRSTIMLSFGLISYRPSSSLVSISAGDPSAADPGPKVSRSDSTKNKVRLRFRRTGNLR